MSSNAVKILFFFRDSTPSKLGTTQSGRNGPDQTSAGGSVLSRASQDSTGMKVPLLPMSSRLYGEMRMAPCVTCVVLISTRLFMGQKMTSVPSAGKRAPSTATELPQRREVDGVAGGRVADGQVGGVRVEHDEPAVARAHHAGDARFDDPGEPVSYMRLPLLREAGALLAPRGRRELLLQGQHR